LYNLWYLYHEAVPVNVHFGQESCDGIFFPLLQYNAYNVVFFYNKTNKKKTLLLCLHNRYYSAVAHAPRTGKE